MAAVFAACLGATLAPAALAGRPLQTEDAGLLEPGASEFESALLRTRARAQAPAEAGYAALGYGVSTQWQTGLSLGRSREGGRSQSTAAWAGKFQLLRSGSATGSALGVLPGDWALAWVLNVERTPRRWHEASDAIKLVNSSPLPGGTLHANLGVEHHLGVPHAVRSTWALAYEPVGWAVGEASAAPTAEVLRDGAGERWLNLGTRLTLLPQRAYVDAAWGRSRLGTRAMSLGMRLAW